MFNTVFMTLERSLSMSAAIVLLALLTNVFRRKTTPDKRHLCWLIIAVCLLVPYRPTLLSLPFALPTYLAPSGQYNTPLAVNQAQDGIGQMDRSKVYHWDDVSTPQITVEASKNSGMGAIDETNVTIPPIFNSMGKPDIQNLIFTLWAVGGLSMALFNYIRHRRFVIALKLWSKDACLAPASHMLDEIRRIVGIKRHISLWTCPLISTPIVMGLIRPIIVLPEYVIEDDKLYLILLHEALHVKRGDLWARALLGFY